MSGDSVAPAQLTVILETASGRAVTPEEVSAAMRALAPANPAVVTFDEFYKVLRTSERRVGGPALTDASH